MKKLLLLLALFACRSEQATPNPDALVRVAPPVADLYEMRLPAGDVGSINVGWFNNGAPKLDPRTWLDDGDDTDPEPDDYDGVKFVGQGVDVTHLRCTSWDGITVAVIQHDGIVQLENLTLHCGYNQGTQFGEQNVAKKLSPKFAARLVDCKVVAETVPLAEIQVAIEKAPQSERLALDERLANTLSTFTDRMLSVASATQVRPKWLVFGYQCDLYLYRCTFIGKQAVEHDVYFHGFSNKGAIVQDCTFESAGAEVFKVRSDRTETVAVLGTSIVIRNTKFSDWHQDWSWRGGAGIVLQGGASDVFVDRCFFKAGPGTAATPAHARSHAIEIVAEDNSHGGTYGNGHVWIRSCAMFGHSEVDWSNTILRVARNSGTQMAARSVTIEKCGIYGQKVLVQVGQIPAGKGVLRECNTAEIKTKLSPLFSTAAEAMIPTATQRVPVSRGWTW